MELNEMIRRALKQNYNVPKGKVEKMVELLTMRACRFYVDGNLDAVSVEEDLEKGNLDYSLDFEKKSIEVY